MAHTGDLPPRLFDSLMLEKTTFPPVVEGCSSRETCESSGRPFIRGGSMHDALDTYIVDDEKYTACQNIHTKASQCLRQGNRDEIPALVTYMRSAFTEENFRVYHRKRQQAFLERPDACEIAFRELMIRARESIKPPIDKGHYATGLTTFKAAASESDPKISLLDKPKANNSYCPCVIL
jgi:hypothetical protein